MSAAQSGSGDRAGAGADVVGDLFGADGAEPDQVRDRAVRGARLGGRGEVMLDFLAAAGVDEPRLVAAARAAAVARAGRRGRSRAPSRRGAEQLPVGVALEERVADELDRDAVERREFVPAGFLDERFGLPGCRSSRRRRARRRRALDRRSWRPARRRRRHRQ
jgi:hypothetical protein